MCLEQICLYIVAILIILVDIVSDGKIVLTLSEAIGYLVTYAANAITIAIASGKIPNKLKTDDGKIDLGKFDTKLPVDQGYRGPGKWKIQKDTAGHGGRKWKLFKGAEIIASLYEDGTIANFY